MSASCALLPSTIIGRSQPAHRSASSAAQTAVPGGSMRSTINAGATAATRARSIDTSSSTDMAMSQPRSNARIMPRMRRSGSATSTFVSIGNRPAGLRRARRRHRADVPTCRRPRAHRLRRGATA
ncbi:hypothetical protein WJ24_14525 [Burkholderia vietnamiensis]|nr:hypothetical protein WJ24_14525 [Burkholderia vietnamiensis]